MAKSSKTEQEALYQAIVKLSGDADKQYYPHLCSLYDKLTGVKYAKCKGTLEFIKQVDEIVQSTVKGG